MYIGHAVITKVYINIYRYRNEFMMYIILCMYINVTYVKYAVTF